MGNAILQTAYLITIAFFSALILTRLMGRKLISQMTFFDFIVGVSMGSIIANFALIQEQHVASAATALVCLTILVVLMEYVYLGSMTARKLINSEPVTLIDQGHIVDKNLRKIRMNLSDLMVLLRNKNIFNIADVEYAIMETNGKLSVLAKAPKQPVKPADLNIPSSYQGLTRDLIMDGAILEENLKSAHLGKSQLISQLQSNGVQDVKEVFYAGLDSAGNIYVSLKQKRKERDGQYGID